MVTPLIEPPPELRPVLSSGWFSASTAIDKAHGKAMVMAQKDQDALHDEILQGINAWKALKVACKIKEPVK